MKNEDRSNTSRLGNFVGIVVIILMIATVPAAIIYYRTELRNEKIELYTTSNKEKIEEIDLGKVDYIFESSQLELRNETDKKLYSIKLVRDKELVDKKHNSHLINYKFIYPDIKDSNVQLVNNKNKLVIHRDNLVYDLINKENNQIVDISLINTTPYVELKLSNVEEMIKKSEELKLDYDKNLTIKKYKVDILNPNDLSKINKTGYLIELHVLHTFDDKVLEQFSDTSTIDLKYNEIKERINQ